MLLIGYITYQAYLYYKTLIVTGAPNEWVVVMRGDKQVAADIGLTCVKMPFDNVVKFPELIHKVNFVTKQISKEMQGLEVAAMIVWSIFREGDGPMRAYR